MVYRSKKTEAVRHCRKCGLPVEYISVSWRKTKLPVELEVKRLINEAGEEITGRVPHQSSNRRGEAVVTISITDLVRRMDHLETQVAGKAQAQCETWITRLEDRMRILEAKTAIAAKTLVDGIKSLFEVAGR